MAMSELNRRRLRNFRRNKRAFWSLIIFSVLFVASLFAELIANDKPLLVRYQGSFYAPFLNFYPEKRSRLETAPTVSHSIRRNGPDVRAVRMGGRAYANTLKRLSSSMKVLSPIGASLLPNGICARSVQLAGSCQRAWIWASISGL